MARDETGKRHGRGGDVGRMARDKTGKLARADAETSGGWRATKRENWHGRMRKRRADGARRNGKTTRKGRRRRADGARRNGKTGTSGCGNVGRMARDETGKLARADGETSGGWRATKRENWHGRGGNHKRGGGKIDANRPQQQIQPNKLAVTPE